MVLDIRILSEKTTTTFNVITNILHNLDKDVTTRLGDEFWERLGSIVGILTHMNL